MTQHHAMNRRRFLGLAAGASAGLVAGPATSWSAGPVVAASSTTAAAKAFVDDYLTNTTANLTAETNAAVRVLSGMAGLWRTGDSWNTGSVRTAEVLRANIRYVERMTAARTDAQARQAFVIDRRHQSYSIADGLGPLTGPYRAGARSVTGITAAPDGTPPARVSETLPADAPPGSALGAGSPDSQLGAVVTLVNTLRGPHASSNPAKLAFQYPRPWRMTTDSRVVDTGAVDTYGFPAYRSKVVVAPQLLRQRGTEAADDGGYVSGHTNALYLAALALGYAVPQRFQELLACAAEYSHTRIVSGMHSPLDVVGGRILATALAAAALHDPRNAALKEAASRQAAGYFEAHPGDASTDPFADHGRNARAFTDRLTYVLPRRGRTVAMVVPKGAEVLLETRLPYLDAAQRREVLRTTALPSGYPVLDGPEQWGRLNLFAAADGYGAFAADVDVALDAAAGGFAAGDTWRNDIAGPGGLVKRGSGALTLAGVNRYRGRTRVEAGVLVAAAAKALGAGGVEVRGGALRVLPVVGGVRVQGNYRQASGAVLEATVRHPGRPALTVGRSAHLAADSVLTLRLDPANPPSAGTVLRVLVAGRLHGRFRSVTVDAPGLRAVPRYTDRALTVELRSA